ncbi:MAG TPA: hypothetical protein VGE26_08420 [Sphingobacteriaceae bacterium]
MKKYSNISPFIMMLVPVFLVIAVFFFTTGTEIPVEKYQASTSFRMPSLNGSPFTVLVKAIF